MQDVVADVASPERKAEPGSALADAKLSRERALAHKRRCRLLPPVSPRETERLVSQFLARHGGATRCPPAYAAPVG